MPDPTPERIGCAARLEHQCCRDADELREDLATAASERDDFQRRAVEAEQREREQVSAVYATNARLRREKAHSRTLLKQAIGLLERWNKLSGPTCEELQSDTCAFLETHR